MQRAQSLMSELYRAHRLLADVVLTIPVCVQSKEQRQQPPVGNLAPNTKKDLKELSNNVLLGQYIN